MTMTIKGSCAFFCTGSKATCMLQKKLGQKDVVFAQDQNRLHYLPISSWISRPRSVKLHKNILSMGYFFKAVDWGSFMFK